MAEGVIIAKKTVSLIINNRDFVTEAFSIKIIHKCL